MLKLGKLLPAGPLRKTHLRLEINFKITLRYAKRSVRRVLGGEKFIHRYGPLGRYAWERKS
jgi:hypothetical protein